jgi:hypothetical protein
MLCSAFYVHAMPMPAHMCIQHAIKPTCKMRALYKLDVVHPGRLVLVEEGVQLRVRLRSEVGRQVRPQLGEHHVHPIHPLKICGAGRGTSSDLLRGKP